MRKDWIFIVLIVVSVIVLTSLFVACDTDKNSVGEYVTLKLFTENNEVLDNVKVKTDIDSKEGDYKKGDEILKVAPNGGYVYTWVGKDSQGIEREVIGDGGILKLDGAELFEIFGSDTIKLTPKAYYTKLTIENTNNTYIAIFDSYVDSIFPPASRDKYDFKGYYIEDGEEKVYITDRDGNFFDNWNRTEAELTVRPGYEGKTFKVELDYGVADDKELTQKGDSDSTVPGTFKYNEAINYIFPKPVRPGYKFQGWYSKQEGGYKITDDRGVYIGGDVVFNEKYFDSDFSNTDEIIKIYAKWAYNTYTVTYDFNGEKYYQDIEYGRPIYDYAQEIKDGSLGVVPEGMVFSYWQADDEKIPFDFANRPQTTKEITLTAVFKKHAIDDENATHTKKADPIKVVPHNTCTEAGYYAYVCEVCGKILDTKDASDEEWAEPKGHSYSVTNWYDKTEKCDHCGDEIERTLIIIPDTVETIVREQFKEYASLEAIVIPSSVISIGIDAFSGCTSLKKIYLGKDVTTTSITQNHGLDFEKYSIWFYVDSNKDNPDSKNYWTYVDGLPQERETVHRHTFVVTEGVVEATCVLGGYSFKISTCQECGFTKKDIIDGTETPIKGHTYEENYPACKGQVCSVCETVIIEPTMAHTFGEGVIENKGNCREYGKVKYTCSVCNTEKIENVIGDHNFEEYYTQETTCVQGYILSKCSVCETTKKDYLKEELKEHSWSTSSKSAISPKITQINYGCIWCNKKKYEYVDQSGNVYIGISNKEELLKYALENTKANFLLLGDIDLNGELWRPWGLNGEFSGIFDGNGYTIENVNISQNNEDIYGFFSSVTGTVRNLILSNISIKSSTTSQAVYLGSVAGKLNGIIEGVTVIGDINLVAVNGNASIGGIVGSLEKGSVIASSFTTGLIGINLDVNKLLNVGGIAGKVSTEGLLSNVLFKGSMNGISSKSRINVGGAVGINYGNIYRAIIEGSIDVIQARSTAAGGLVGNNNGYLGYSLSDCSIYGVSSWEDDYDSNGGRFDNVYQKDDISTYSNKNIIRVTPAKALTSSWQRELLGNESVLWQFASNSMPTLKSGEFLYQCLDNTYALTTKEQLRGLDGSVLKYRLAGNINLKGASFTPVNTFYGELQGEGFTISNYRIVNGEYKALIVANYGRVENIKVEFYSEYGDYFPCVSEGVIGYNGDSLSSFNGVCGEAYSIESVEYKVRVSLTWQILLALFVPIILLGVLSFITFLVKVNGKSYGGIALTTNFLGLAGLITVVILAIFKCVSQIMTILIAAVVLVFSVLMIFIVCIRKKGYDDTLRPYCNALSFLNILVAIIEIFLAIFLL